MKQAKRLLFAPLILISTYTFSQCELIVEYEGDPTESVALCSGEEVTLNGVFTDDCDNCLNNAQQTTITWTFDGQSFEGESLTNSFIESTQITITVASDCPDVDTDELTATIDITVNELPEFTIELTPGSQSLCIGNNVTFGITGIMPGDIASYSWGGDANGNGSTDSVNNVNSNIEVECTIVDVNGCEATTTTDFSASPAPSIQILPAPQGPYCEGESFMLSASPNGTPSFACLWTSPGGIEFDNCLANIDASNPDDHHGTWNIDVVDENGCEGESSINVTIIEDPDVSLSLTSEIVCPDAEPVQMLVSPANGSYTVTPQPGTNPIVGNLFDPELSGTGVFEICYQINATGCIFEQCEDITVTDVTIPSFTNNLPSTCTSGPAIILADYTTPSLEQGQEGVFTINNGCSEVTTFNPSPGDPCISIGNNPVTYTLTDANGCVSEANAFITVFPELSADPISNFEVCTGAEINLIGNIQGGEEESYDIIWTPATGLSNAAVANPVISNAQSSETYAVNVTDANGCSASGTTAIEVFPQPEITSVTQNPQSFCAGQTNVEVTFNNNWENNDWDITPTYNYNWGLGSLSESTSSTVTIPNEIFESLQVFVTANFGGGSGCNTVNTNYTLDPVPDPDPQIVTEQNEICSGEQVMFSVTDMTDGSEFDWQFTPAPSTLSIIGNGNVAIASWSMNQNDVTASVEESLVNCMGTDEVTVGFSSSEAPVTDAITLLGSNILVYPNSEPDCYRWGYIDETGVFNVILNDITDLPETSQSVVLDEINPSYIYYCEVWFGNCNTPQCSTTSFFDESFVFIGEVEEESNFSVSPNPSTGQFHLRTTERFTGDMVVEVKNTRGQLVETGSVNALGTNHLLDLSHLAPNCYFILLRNNDGYLHTARIIIHR